MLMMTAMFALVGGGGDDVAAALRIKMMMATSPVASLPKPEKLSETLLAHLFALCAGCASDQPDLGKV